MPCTSLGRALIAILPVVAVLAVPAWAAGAVASGPVAMEPAAAAFKLGELQLWSLRDAGYVIANDGKTFGLDAGAEAVAGTLRGAKARDDRITLSVNALLVRSGEHLVLIDTGLGAQGHGALLGSLRQAGFGPEQVTDVLLTHSHGDHIGGLVDAQGRLVFARATVHLAPAEWDWVRSKPEEARLAAALAAHVAPAHPGEVVVPGIVSLGVTGHTPGHMAYEISSGTARLLDIGDTAHSSIVSLAHPEWTMFFDNDQERGKSSREALLGRLAADHELVFAPHFPYPGVGFIVRSGTGYAWQPKVP